MLIDLASGQPKSNDSVNVRLYMVIGNTWN